MIKNGIQVTITGKIDKAGLPPLPLLFFSLLSMLDSFIFFWSSRPAKVEITLNYTIALWEIFFQAQQYALIFYRMPTVIRPGLGSLELCYSLVVLLPGLNVIEWVTVLRG